MAIELVVPKVGESIAEVEIAEWRKQEGEAVARDEIIVLLDSAKTTVELPSPISGTLGKILKQVGEAALIGEVLALLEEGAASSENQKPKTENRSEPEPEWEKEKPKAAPTGQTQTQAAPEKSASNGAPRVMPAAARALSQNDLQPQEVEASGPGGRLLKEDVQRHLKKQPAKVEAKTSTIKGTPEISPIEQPSPAQTISQPAPQTQHPAPSTSNPNEQPVRMSLLRREIARRLVEAQQNAALLTTFNEINMSAVLNLRKEHQDSFTKKYNIKLGFMSFFVKATIDALKLFPAINAEIRGTDIVYRNYFDIGVAIGSGKGLVVPILRRAELLSFAQVEQAISDLAKRAKDGTLKPDELEGGTFSITNGGIYGSLLSTPIVNPPQSGILGMHSIQERPIAKNGEVVIAPMMYVALTYDHRLVDGREAVSFLVRVKECIENPARMLLEV